LKTHCAATIYYLIYISLKLHDGRTIAPTKWIPTIKTHTPANRLSLKKSLTNKVNLNIRIYVFLRSTHMGRPSRDWIRKTYTVSPVVEKAIKARAGELGIDEGTLVDAYAWRELVQPTASAFKNVKFTDEEMERIFAEEALQLLDKKDAIALLSEEIVPKGADGEDLPNAAASRVLETMLKRWRTMRIIDKEHQAAVKDILSNHEVVPSILKYGLVDEEWFLP
jgi:hypothetical protein